MQGKNKPKTIDFGLIKAIVFICFCDDVRIKMTLVELVIQKKPPKWTVSKMVSALGLLGGISPSSSFHSDRLTASACFRCATEPRAT